MRSRTPKLLHPLCGRPMIAWPVAAARAAGAGKIVVVDSPDRPLAAALAGDVEGAVQARPLGAALDDAWEVPVKARPRGTAAAVHSAAAQIEGAGTVIVVNGDVPLVT